MSSFEKCSGVERTPKGLSRIIILVRAPPRDWWENVSHGSPGNQCELLWIEMVCEPTLPYTHPLWLTFGWGTFSGKILPMVCVTPELISGSSSVCECCAYVCMVCVCVWTVEKERDWQSCWEHQTNRLKRNKQNECACFWETAPPPVRWVCLWVCLCVCVCECVCHSMCMCRGEGSANLANKTPRKALHQRAGCDLSTPAFVPAAHTEAAHIVCTSTSIQPMDSPHSTPLKAPVWYAFRPYTQRQAETVRDSEREREGENERKRQIDRENPFICDPSEKASKRQQSGPLCNQSLECIQSHSARHNRPAWFIFAAVVPPWSCQPEECQNQSPRTGRCLCAPPRGK